MHMSFQSRHRHKVHMNIKHKMLVTYIIIKKTYSLNIFTFNNDKYTNI